ncbi:MAG: iron-containing alcohol dehydrogenase [Deltaproteobacteria bacterium]|nr:iron-containing alcohol dehydrogenase [Deltaproteobacteria bacterium]
MLPSYYEFYNPVKIISGEKALDNLPYELNRLQVTRPLIITDKGVTDAGLVKTVIRAFAESGIILGGVYDDVPSDSSVTVVNDIAGVFRRNECDGLIAVGGGSPIDTAKAVNILVSEEGDNLFQFAGHDVLRRPLKPLVVIPTTAGTGSEVTYVAVIADPSRKVKMSFTSAYLYPRLAVLDPRMTLSIPPGITAATGMDALSHAMEAVTCLQKNPISDALAMASIDLIGKNLLKVVAHGRDEEARLAMSNAACLAGAAFSNSMVGLVHSLGHAAGGVAGVPHGVAMSIFLPYVFDYNMEKTAPDLARLLLPFGGPEEYANTPPAHRARRTIELIRALRQSLYDLCQLPRTLKEAEVSRDKLEAIARTAINDGSLTFNPVEVTYDDALLLLREAYD